MSPSEAGMGFAVSMKKPINFIGKDCHIKDKADSIPSKLAMFKVASLTRPEILIPSDSPMYAKNGDRKF